MTGTLDVLVVDDRPDTVRFLTEFLLQRCRCVDVAASAKEAMTAVTRRRTSGETYHLILSDLVMPGADGLTFLRELRMRKEDIPFAFITGYRSLNPSLESEANKLGVLAILEKPIELREVEKLLEGCNAEKNKQRVEKAGQQPFFGTSRVLRRSAEPNTTKPTAPSEALEPRLPNIPAPAMPVVQPPQVAGYQRRPSAIMPISARFRRSTDAAAPSAPGTVRIGESNASQPGTAFTARTRRGVEGTASFNREAGSRTESGKMVNCTQCSRSFLALAKAEAYTTVCVHCGHMQRIEPS